MSRPTPTTDGYAPGRQSVVTFDEPDFTLCQQWWLKTLKNLEITGKADRSGTADVHFVPGIGFQLKTLHDVLQYVHEQNLGDPVRHDLSTGLPNYANSFLREVASGTGVADTGSQGDKHNKREQAAADSWANAAYNLNAGDGASYVKPSETEIIPVDRVFRSASPMQPDQTLWLRFWVPGVPGGASIGIVARVYFTGLSSSPNDATEGTGQYALTLMGDGNAILYEKDVSDAWRTRRMFVWSPAHQVNGNWHVVGIRSDAYLDTAGEWQGRVINIQCQATQNDAASIWSILNGIIEGANTTQYVVPQTKAQHITPVPVRLDIRRNLRMKLSLSFTKFKSTGTLQTQTFNNPWTMGAIGSSDPKIQITITGSFPTGTTASLQLYGKDGTSCGAASSVTSSAEQVQSSFARINDQQEYYAVVTLNASSDGLSSPTIRQFDVYRQGLISSSASTPFQVPPTALLNYSVVGPGMDPQVETASIGLMSLQDGFTLADDGVDDPLASLTKQSGKAIRIEITGLPSKVINGHAQTTSTTFIGKMVRLTRLRKGHKIWKADGSGVKPFPSHTWWQGVVTAAGWWKRLWQAKTTSTKNWGEKDPATNQIYTITKVSQLTWANAGLPAAMLDLMDVPITLQVDPNDKEPAYQIEVFSEALGWMLQLARDFLGASYIFDANATNGGGSTDKNGCLRLKFPPRPAADGSYYPIAKFVEDATWNDGAIRSKANVNSYPAIDRGDGVMIPQCPVFGEDEHHSPPKDWDEVPEGNCVYVLGTVATQSGGSLSASSANEQLWAIIHNWPAAQFFDGQPIACDPAHPDYTDGSPNLIVVIDPSLNTQGAVNFAARRIFDFACHRRKYKSIHCPDLRVLGANPRDAGQMDPLQVRLRPLTYGDCVLYGDDTEPWWVSGVVLDVQGEYGGTKNGGAIYELCQIPKLQGVDDGTATVYQDSQLYAPVAGGVM